MPLVGVAIMWRAYLDKHVTALKLHINWLTGKSGIRIQFENQVYIILCVYICHTNAVKMLMIT